MILKYSPSISFLHVDTRFRNNLFFLFFVLHFELQTLNLHIPVVVKDQEILFYWFLNTVAKCQRKNYISFRSIRSKLSSKIVISQCISRMIYLIINLATSNRIYHIKDFVITLAFWEYFRLSTSTWMGVEAFNIYKRAFQNGSPKHFLIRASVIAWGE